MRQNMKEMKKETRNSNLKENNGEFMKRKIVQSLAGAVVLTLLMKVFGLTGFGAYTWMLFLPLLLFFALGADMKKIPSMFICYCCGIAWTYLNSLVQALFDALAPSAIAGFLPTVIVIFSILVVHEGLLRNTIFGNIPSLFLGMSTMFAMFMLNLPLNGLHLIGFFAYGLFLCVMLILVGTLACRIVFREKKTAKATAVLKTNIPFEEKAL